MPTTVGLQTVEMPKTCLSSRRAAAVGAGYAAPLTPTRQCTRIKIRGVIFALILNASGSHRDEIREHSAAILLLMVPAREPEAG